MQAYSSTAAPSTAAPEPSAPAAAAYNDYADEEEEIFDEDVDFGLAKSGVVAGTTPSQARVPPPAHRRPIEDDEEDFLDDEDEGALPQCRAGGHVPLCADLAAVVLQRQWRGSKRLLLPASRLLRLSRACPSRSKRCAALATARHTCTTDRHLFAQYIANLYALVYTQPAPLAEIQQAHDQGWSRLTEKFYQKQEWPEAEVIAPLVNGGQCLLS